MKGVWFSFPVALLLAGCGSDVSLVKDGVMDFNQTITVGQALDNWRSCDGSNWEEFETENGVRVVSFECNHDIAMFIDKVKKAGSHSTNDMSSLDVASITSIFQFTINQDDSFQLDGIYTRSVWADGEQLEDSSTKPLAILKKAYENTLHYDPDNNSQVLQYSWGLPMVKRKAG
jgi:hypothetical protein